MKKIAGPLRLELAQFRELAAFAQFGSDLSQDTLDRLRHGERIVETLKQPQYKPVPVEEQVVIFYILTKRYLNNVKPIDIKRTQNEFLEFCRREHSDLLTLIREKKAMSPEVEEKITAAITAFMEGR
jgi:F-type H+-transporting ATPase subunit alpha